MVLQNIGVAAILIKMMDHGLTARPNVDSVGRITEVISETTAKVACPKDQDARAISIHWTVGCNLESGR